MFDDANHYNVIGGAETFRTRVQQWKADGFDGVVLTNGGLPNVNNLLTVADEEGFEVWGNDISSVHNFLYTWNGTQLVPRTEPASQAEADTIVQGITDAIKNHPSLKGYYLVDEPGTWAIERLQMLKSAYDRFDGARPVFAVLIGTDRVGPIQNAVGFERLAIDIYPAAYGRPEQEFNLNGFGYNSLSFRDYFRQVTADANLDQTTTPLMVILQTHDVRFDNPIFDLRRPTLPEIRRQFFESIGEGADLISWFIWQSRAVDVNGKNGWTGLESLPAEYGVIKSLAGRVKPFAGVLREAARASSQDFTTTGGHYVSTLRTPSAGAVRTLVVACNTSTATATLPVNGLAGTLRDLETNVTMTVGSSVTLNAGDGRIYEWTAAANANPTGHEGVPSIRVSDFTKDVETWWDGHPFNPESTAHNPIIKPIPGHTVLDVNAAPYNGDLWAAIQALPNGGGRVMIGDGNYNAAAVYPGNFLGLAKNNVHLIAKDGASPVFNGILRMIPVWEARDYSQWSLANSLNSNTNVDDPLNPGQKLKARTVISQYRIRGWYLKGITFDAQGATQNLSLSTAADCVFDSCTFQGIIRAASGHPGHVTGNSTLDNIWFRNCRFRGKYNFAGAGLSPVLAIYLDGLYGGGAIGCTFDNGAFAERDLLFLCNDDFSRDYNLDGSIPVAEHRMAQYVVSYGNMGGAQYSHMDVTGRNWLCDRYDRLAGTMAFSLVRADSKSNNIDNPPLPKWLYRYTGGVVRRCKVAGMGGTGYLVRHMAQNPGPYPNTIAPQIGQYIVKDNIVTVPGFNRWAIDEGPNPPGHIGPNTVVRNLTAGTIPPPVIGGGSGESTPAQVVFTTQPVGGDVGQPLSTQPVIEVRDSTGTLMSGYSGTATLSFSTNPTGANLTGTVSVPVSSGVATFSGIGISLAGNGYRLRATVGSVSGDSISLNVAPAVVPPPPTPVPPLPKFVIYKDNPSGLGVTTAMTPPVGVDGVKSGDKVVAVIWKSPTTVDFSNAPTVAAISNWGTAPSRPFTCLPNSQQVVTNGVGHVSAVLLRTATGDESEYVINFVSGNGGGTRIIYFVFAAADVAPGSDWIRLVAKTFTDTASNAPLLAAGNVTTYDNELVVACTTNGLASNNHTVDAGWTDVITPPPATRWVYGEYKAFPVDAGAAIGEMSPGMSSSTTWSIVAWAVHPTQVEDAPLEATIPHPRYGRIRVSLNFLDSPGRG